MYVNMQSRLGDVQKRPVGIRKLGWFNELNCITHTCGNLKSCSSLRCDAYCTARVRPEDLALRLCPALYHYARMAEPLGMGHNQI
jgi:hypothetical protein